MDSSRGHAPASVLMDCGEGTVGALARMLGPAGAQSAIDSLVAVWISHKHADHCLGLPAVIAQRSAQRGGVRLLLVLPAPVREWLEAAHPHLISSVTIVPCRHFAGGPHAPPTHHGAGRDTAMPAMRNAGFVGWACPRVKHCYEAYGLVLEHAQGWKLVVSGDTAEPCEELRRLGHGATILVHEATFRDEHAADAAAKRHSTLGQALAAAAAMGVWRVLLTHFSARYSWHAPGVWAGARDARHAVARAVPMYDGAVVPFDRLHALPLLARLIDAGMSADDDDT
jgi:ribonuclease Z